MKKIFLTICIFIIGFSVKAQQFKLPEIIVDTAAMNICKQKGHAQGELLFIFGNNMKPTLIDKKDSVWVLYPNKEIRVYRCLRCGQDMPDKPLIIKVLLYPKYGLKHKPQF